ncbi:HD domain-containing protein [Vibrio makurazakiensis]|uniref:HD domain-containing protein n=1 Tax=Vibrio makurazakiensis TaxID=2910250 RepID=UPI003D09FB9B
MQTDAAHDLNHILRVVKTAKQLCRAENAVEEVVVPAAYLHDCFTFPKNHPDRERSSKHAADIAIEFLKSVNYPEQYYSAIHHAIVSHSYSANVTPETLEAKIVQDADRLDALGAVGIARCVQVSTSLGRTLYSLTDPFCESREPDDKVFTIDHFYIKLLHLVDTMNTDSAKREAERRTQFMRSYLVQLESEI